MIKFDVQFHADNTEFDLKFQERVGSFSPAFGEVSIVDYEPNTYILEDEAGNEVVAVLVDTETVFDATPNDIRIGKTAVTDDGVTVGEKVIPSYNTSEGAKVIPSGSRITLPTPNYKYTKLQAIICSFNTNLDDSVSAENVVINNRVYNVQSVIPLSVVSTESYGEIDFGIINSFSQPCILRYFSYKEIY